MKNKYKKIVIGVIAFTPFMLSAQEKTLKTIAVVITEYLDIALSLIIGLAVVTFVWNVYIYFFTEKDKTEAGKYVMYSVIGFFVILSFWGLVALIRNSIKLDDKKPDILNNILNVNYNNKTDFVPAGKP